jgi:hypothetical protein
MVWRSETRRRSRLTRPKKNHEGNHPLGGSQAFMALNFICGYGLTRGFLPRNVLLIYEMSNQFKGKIVSATPIEMLPIALPGQIVQARGQSSFKGCNQRRFILQVAAIDSPPQNYPPLNI